jgi:hypothetical protein
MSGRISIAFVDFAVFSYSFGSIRCVSIASFLVRNWCGVQEARIKRQTAALDLLTLNHRVPGSSPGAPTIQSPQTAHFRYDAKRGVSAGISGHSFLGFWSLQAFAHFGDCFWRRVSASKNSVPGG